MENNQTTRSLRLIVPDSRNEPDADTPREEYWAQVQALRAELAALRPAN